MAPPIYYYYFAGTAVAAVLFLVINAVAILCSSSVKEFAVAVKLRRGKLRWMPERRYKLEEGKEECSVCLSAFADGDRVRDMPHCLHTFHLLCIDKWLAWHCSCPICRAEVLPPETKKSLAGCGVQGFNGTFDLEQIL